LSQRPPRGAWPVTLTHGEVTLRPIRLRDADAWRAARQRNTAWLLPWDATAPPGDHAPPTTFRRLVWRMRRQARQGTTYPFVIEVDGRFAGQVTVNNVVAGSARFGSIGYWIDKQYAGRGVVPLAVALVADHCFTALKLHRLEVAIRPENSNSLRVMEKLGIREVGYAPRYLHIDGDWRDHRLYAITAEECAVGGLVSRVAPD